MPLSRPGRQEYEHPAIGERLDLVTLGRVEVQQAVAGNAQLVRAAADEQLPAQQEDERMLMHLVILQQLTGGQREQDDPVGVRVRAQHLRCVRGHLLGVKLPRLHLAIIDLASVA